MSCGYCDSIQRWTLTYAHTSTLTHSSKAIQHTDGGSLPVELASTLLGSELVGTGPMGRRGLLGVSETEWYMRCCIISTFIKWMVTQENAWSYLSLSHNSHVKFKVRERQVTIACTSVSTHKHHTTHNHKSQFHSLQWSSLPPPSYHQPPQKNLMVGLWVAPPLPHPHPSHCSLQHMTTTIYISTSIKCIISPKVSRMFIQSFLLAKGRQINSNHSFLVLRQSTMCVLMTLATRANSLSLPSNHQHPQNLINGQLAAERNTLYRVKYKLTDWTLVSNKHQSHFQATTTSFQIWNRMQI